MLFKKRIMSLVLILAITFSFSTFSVFASEPKEVIFIENSITIDLLYPEEISSDDTYGRMNWPTLAAALKEYGAKEEEAIPNGIGGSPTGGYYQKYYIQMTGWKIHFGVLIVF